MNIEIGDEVHIYTDHNGDDVTITTTLVAETRTYDVAGLERFSVAVELCRETGERIIVPCGVPDELTVEQALAVAAALTMAATA